MNKDWDDLRKAKLRYQTVLIFLYLPLMLHVIWLSIRYADWRFALQRLGFGIKFTDQKPIWIHAASVGEVVATIPLVEALRLKFPKQPILMTTTTPTGMQTIKNRLVGSCDYCYLPIDWSYAVNAFLSKTKPLSALIIETEIWPNLYHAINAQDIPLITVNGRISHRTLDAPVWILELYRDCIKKIDTVLARSRQDGDRFISLGVTNERVKVVGNLKFSPSKKEPDDIKPIISQPYIVAVSTHKNEEQQLAQLWQQAAYKNILLVIVPRHPKRRSSIIKTLSGYTDKFAVRSKADVIQTDTKIYLADSFGELENFMTFADVVIMGGSFINHGGQNILEPARLGKAIITGPSMENFADECELLLHANAIIQCTDQQDLDHQLQTLLQSPEQVLSLGNNAKKTIQKYADVVDRYIEIIQPYLVPAP